MEFRDDLSEKRRANVKGRSPRYLLDQADHLPWRALLAPDRTNQDTDCAMNSDAKLFGHKTRRGIVSDQQAFGVLARHLDRFPLSRVQRECLGERKNAVKEFVRWGFLRQLDLSAGKGRGTMPRHLSPDGGGNQNTRVRKKRESAEFVQVNEGASVANEGRRRVSPRHADPIARPAG